MHHAFFVSSFERVRNLRGNLQRLLQRNRTRSDAIRQRRAFDQLHHDGTVFESVDHRDVGMIQRRQHFGFTLEASQAVRMMRQCRGQNFYGDIAVELCVASAVHFTHAARAERRKNLVGAQSSPCGERHMELIQLKFTGSRSGLGLGNGVPFLDPARGLSSEPHDE